MPVNVSAKAGPVIPPYRFFTEEAVAKIDAYVERHLRDEDSFCKLKSKSAVIAEVWPLSTYDRKLLTMAYIELRKASYKITSIGRGEFQIERGTTPERQLYEEDWEMLRPLLYPGAVLSNKDLNEMELITPQGHRHALLACMLAYEGYNYEHVGVTYGRYHNYLISDFYNKEQVGFTPTSEVKEMVV